MSLFRKFFLIFALIGAFCLFSSASFAESELSGSYSCESLLMEGESFEALELYPSGCTLEIYESGEAYLTLAERGFDCRWLREGERFSLQLAGKSYGGTARDGLIRLDMDGIVFSFLRSGSSMPSVPETPLIADAESGGLSLWNGDWYGQWRIFNAGGDWLELDGQSYDLFARVHIGDDGTGSMLLWDEELSLQEPMAELELGIVGYSEDVMGAAMVEGGWFWQMEPEGGMWGFGSNIAGFDRLIALENAHYESSEGSFDFTLLLRPWGCLWDDVADVDEASLPFYYYDWYLPMLEQGQAMPSSFDDEVLTGSSAGQ